MNNIFKILIVSVLIFSVSEISAQEILYTWEEGVIANVEFSKDDYGKVFIDNQLVYKGSSENIIEGIVTQKIESGNYIEICGLTCASFFWNKKTLIEIDTGTKGFVSKIRDFDEYILFISNIPDSSEWIISLYDKNSSKQIGARYFENINLIDVLLDEQDFIINLDNTSNKTVPISSFTDTSLINDNITARENRSQKDVPFKKIFSIS